MVNITQSHILWGHRNDPFDGPIARAMGDAGYKLVSVGDTDVCYGDPIIQVELSEETQQFIKDFDAGRPVAPFEMSEL